MTRKIRFTRLAEDSLAQIADWTIETFGVRQAEIYEQELLDRCGAIADGTAHNRDCSILAPEGQGMAYTTAGEHFLIHIETSDAIIIVDVLHSRSDLPEKIRALSVS